MKGTLVSGCLSWYQKGSERRGCDACDSNSRSPTFPFPGGPPPSLHLLGTRCLAQVCPGHNGPLCVLEQRVTGRAGIWGEFMLYPGPLKRLADGLSLQNVSLSVKGHSFLCLLGLVACRRVPRRVTQAKFIAPLSLYFPSEKSTQFYPQATWTL